MATISQIRGLLLEEVLLYLLKFSGYKTVLASGDDCTLHLGHSGMEVLGRGCAHQIDAIADFSVATPFSYPQRLLVEAKCYADTRPIGVEVIRNAVGVLKDVSEYWTSQPSGLAKRYHYQYALFATSGFTLSAEKYAFAQDIYLFPLQQSSYFRPIINDIRSIKHTDFGATGSNDIVISLKDFRSFFRTLLVENYAISNQNISFEFVRKIANTCRNIKGLMLGMVSRQFPILLTPHPDFDLNHLKSLYEVEMHGYYEDQNGWTLSYEGQEILSFDIPTKIFELYAERGALRTQTAYQMKADFFTEIQAIVINRNAVPKVVTFRLDRNWLDRLIDQAMTANRRREDQQVIPASELQ